MELLENLCQAFGTGPLLTEYNHHRVNKSPFGHYGRGRKITAPAVNSAITAIGQTIAMATGINPTKLHGSDKLIPRLTQILDGWKKEDPPTLKKLPVEVDIPEYIASLGNTITSSEVERAVGDLVLIAFYYLLRVGEYTTKAVRQNSKQTVQFKLEDITFFGYDKTGRLTQLAPTVSNDEILHAHSATLKIDNQKNGWKGVCIHQESNGDEFLCPVKALGRRVIHMRQNNAKRTTPLSTYFMNGERYDVTDKNIRYSLKHAAEILEYPSARGIPLERIDTHSLRSGGANALSLSGYSDREIQKMGRWRGATFKEYIREELACFSKGMTRSMKQKFGFVNILGGVYHDITPVVIATPYESFASAA